MMGIPRGEVFPGSDLRAGVRKVGGFLLTSHQGGLDGHETRPEAVSLDTATHKWVTLALSRLRPGMAPASCRARGCPCPELPRPGWRNLPQSRSVEPLSAACKRHWLAGSARDRPQAWCSAMCPGSQRGVPRSAPPQHVCGSDSTLPPTQDLLKHTPPGHPDHPLLQDALRISQNFLSSINEEITPRRQSMTVKKGEVGAAAPAPAGGASGWAAGTWWPHGGVVS